MKQNCWEALNCGREEGGCNVKELGVCPASTEAKLNNIHSGENAGRACWIVAGTYCSGEAQGAFVQKVAKCGNCDFYRKVFKEEIGTYKLPMELLKIMNN
jgi:hypothetical protein